MSRLGLSWKVLLGLAIGLASSFGARAIGFPGGAITGALVGTGVARLLNAPLEEPPKWLRSAARALLGLTIGATVTAETVQVVARALGPVAVMILVIMALGLLAAWVINRTTPMALSTALCGASPGALGAMVALADDLGGDGSVVASMHVARLVSILLVVPLLIRALFGHGVQQVAAAAAASAPPDAWWRLAALLLAGAVVATVAVRFKLPAAEMLSGLFVAALLNPLLLHLPTLPATWRLFAQWVVGTGVGAAVTRQTVRAFRPFALAGGLMTAFLIVSGLALGWALSWLGSIDLVTCLVGCAPGGADTMVILAGELGGDVQLVAAMHVARVVILMVLLPILVRFTHGRQAARVAEVR